MSTTTNNENVVFFSEEDFATGIPHCNREYKKNAVNKKDPIIEVGKAYGWRSSVHMPVCFSGDFKFTFVALYPCTRNGCNKHEKTHGKFRSCANCKTKYCSVECSKLDWTEGKHRIFCHYHGYTVQKDLYIDKLFAEKIITEYDVLCGSDKYKKTLDTWEQSKGKQLLEKRKLLSKQELETVPEYKNAY